MNNSSTRKASWGLFAGIAVLVVVAICAYRQLPAVPANDGSSPADLDWPAPPAPLSEVQWKIFRSSGQESISSSSGPISSNYRLAGTFLEYGARSDSVQRSRKAILDDLERGFQALVEEGDVYHGVNVARISKNHVLLEKDGVEEELWLSFSSRDTQDANGKEKIAQTEKEEGPEALETSQFGKRVGETRWVFEKEALRDFYKEMMDNPARAVDIYETMRPNYDANGNIQGYTVDIVGERNFFDTVGLQNGDVVHKVNSMDMTSRNRAEYFMKEFMQDRVNAVVLDIERDDEEKKLIYLLR